MPYSFYWSNILVLNILSNLILNYVYCNNCIIRNFVNIFINIFYNLHKTTNLQIYIFLEIMTKKKIIKYNSIIIYTKSISAVLKTCNYIITTIILLIIKKITIFF